MGETRARMPQNVQHSASLALLQTFAEVTDRAFNS